MQLTHALTIEATEGAEHYRVGGTELLLEPNAVRFILSGGRGWETFVLHPEIAFALARQILAYYDEGNLSGEVV